MPDQPYQSLYRRYRPQRFGEVRGQEHVVRALRNAVREGRVAHAYLFSGPRGTGKTSTARILAKALNCTNLQDGEPCDTCDSCTQVQQGSSLDVHELDAASNNGVDAMRDLVSRASLGTPGRWKVYIIDEVHMLSTAASNALLKTLEEPPGHVVFVLATTDPQKVLPTVRSRTQHFEFRPLQSEVLSDLLRDVNDSASLGVAPEAIDLVVRRVGGSARDALSVLDQVAAAGVIDDELEVIDEMVEALCERDSQGALLAVATGVAAGRDARRLAVELLEHLRNAFLASMAKGLVQLSDEQLVRVEEQARRLGTPALVRAMEVVGDALIDMREAIEPRVILEVALVRVTRPEADTSLEALLERVERLERSVASESTEPARAAAREATQAPPRATRPRPDASESGGSSKPTLGSFHTPTRTTTTAEPPPQPQAPTPEASASASTTTAVLGTVPTRDELTMAWGDTLLDDLAQKARARFRIGRFTSVEGNTATFALPNAIHRDRCEEVRIEVERSLSSYFGTQIKLALVVDTPDLTPAPVADTEEVIDLTELEDAPAGVTSFEDRLKRAFPGAEEVTS